MTSATLCVACAQLPTKDRSLAVKTQHCPECKAVIGASSYGTAFRVQARTRVLGMAPIFFTGATVGAGLSAFVLAIVGLGIWSHDQMAPPQRSAQAPVPREFARVHEVALEDPIPHAIGPHAAKQRIANMVSFIKQTNNDPNKPDQFLVVQMGARKELRGLPFVMGGACRMQGGPASAFQTAVDAARRGMDRDVIGARFDHGDETSAFWTTYQSLTGQTGAASEAGIAALTQILGPERPALRTSMVQNLGRSDRPEATRTIAKAAVFDASLDVRLAALKALRTRPPEQATEILMHGMRYPLASVARQAAQAIIALDRRDLIPQLVNFLGEAAPGDPQVVNGQTCVREVVRINHHRNCLLCHSPSSTGQPNEVPGVIPSPGMPFPSSPSEAYGAAQFSNDPMVRADTTYLRQDFSVRMPVADHGPWPEMQRFDFLVRTRAVDGQELATIQQRVAQRPAGFRSENHKEAAHVLRVLTGHQNVPATKEAWQAVLAAK